MNIINIDSYVAKNAHIDCEKYTCEVLNNSIIKPLNDELKFLMKKDIFFFLMWNEDKELIVKYSKREVIDVSD